MSLLSRWSDAEDRAYKASNAATRRAATTGDPDDLEAADKAGEHHARVFDGYNAEVQRRNNR